MTAPTLRKILWGRAGGQGQDGRGISMRRGPFDTGGDEGGEEPSIPARTGGEAFRDLDQISRSNVKLQMFPPFEAKYVEPLQLQLKSEPFGIICVRILDVLSPELPITGGGMMHFKWDGTQALISSIDGLSSGDRTYKFYFLVVS